MVDVLLWIWFFLVKKINGIGFKVLEKLIWFGINSIGELVVVFFEFFWCYFGVLIGNWLYWVVYGLDDWLVVIELELKLISWESIFECDLYVWYDKVVLIEIFIVLCQWFVVDLQCKGYVSWMIGIKLCYVDFYVVICDVMLVNGVSDGWVICQVVGECLWCVFLEQKICLFGVWVSGLVLLQNFGGV